MGDRCYMELTCKISDKAIFEALGFTDQECADYPGLAQMLDEQANYAHHSAMPTNVVYNGWHGEGGNYCAFAFCCDGQTFLEQPRTNDGALFVTVRGDGTIDDEELNTVRAFIRAEKKVQKMLDTYSEEFTAANPEPEQ